MLAVAYRATLPACCAGNVVWRGWIVMAEKSSRRAAGAADAAPHYHGHRERLRERFLDAGSDALADYELLELLLFRAIPRRDVKPLAFPLIVSPTK